MIIVLSIIFTKILFTAMLAKRLIRTSFETPRIVCSSIPSCSIHLPPDYRAEVIDSIQNNDNVSFHSNISRINLTMSDIERFNKLVNEKYNPPKGYIKNKMQFFMAGSFSAIGFISGYHVLMTESYLIPIVSIPLISFGIAYHLFTNATISDTEYRRRHREIKKELDQLKEKMKKNRN